MVHDGDNPIYLEYRNQDDEIIKKVYYYNYEYFNRLEIPTAVTTIDFASEVIVRLQKTTYSNLEFDNEGRIKKN